MANQSPCLNCTRVKDPVNCENKQCPQWRDWFIKKWDALRAEAPTEEVDAVIHGYWIDSTTTDHTGRIIEHGIDCSVCDSVFKDDSREVVKRWKERFKVCPFCGALMDGDGNGNL